jgi:hypothetical protein
MHLKNMTVRQEYMQGRLTKCPMTLSLDGEECPVVSSLRRTISRMGRPMSVTDRYFKAWINKISIFKNKYLAS